MRPIRSLRAAGLAVVFACGAGVSPLYAHHSFGLFDMSKSAEIDGTVIKLEWSNPHCWLFVMVASPDSAEVSYGFEMTSVGEMIRRGWTKTALKPGDKVKVKFHPVRDGRPAELWIGDSVVMVSAAGQRELFPAFLYVYVDDADGTYRRALAAGAVAMEEPFDTPYGDRRAMVRDPSGNVFQIASRTTG